MECVAAQMTRGGKDVLSRSHRLLLTHIHPDHSGSAPVLARLWGCGVYLHRAELSSAAPDLAAVKQYSNPLGRWVILLLLRVPPRRGRDNRVGAYPTDGDTEQAHARVGVPEPGEAPSRPQGGEQ